MAKHKRAKVAAQSFGVGPDYSIGDPAFADFMRMSGLSLTGTLGETQAMGLTAFYRSCAMIAGTIAGLPLRVYQGTGRDRVQVPHYLSDSPAGPMDMAPFNWVETVVLHGLLHGEAFLKSIGTEGGEVVGQWPVHPLAVTNVQWDGPDKAFRIAKVDGTSDDFVTGQVTHIVGMSTDGLRGISPLSVFRDPLQTALSGERAANRSFVTGALIAGLVTTEEDVDETEARAIKDSLTSKMAGADHAGDIAFVNRSLKFSPWKMTNADAQFLESRRFSVEDVARIFGLPVHLLSVSGAISNWGTGISESNVALQKYVLMAHTSRIESALKAILPPDHTAEFDYKGLLQGSPAVEIDLLLQQVAGGILTIDEARAILNLPPLPPAPMPAPIQETGDIPDGNV